MSVFFPHRRVSAFELQFIVVECLMDVVHQ